MIISTTETKTIDTIKITRSVRVELHVHDSLDDALKVLERARESLDRDSDDAELLKN